MKKTIAIAAIAGLTMLGAAGQASANFEKGNLIMVGYNETTKEVGVDLGNFDNILAGLSSSPTTLATGLDFSAAADVDNKPVSVAFYQDNINMETFQFSMYYATTSAVATTFNNDMNNAVQFDAAASAVSNYYNSLPGTDRVVASPSYPNSYDISMNMGSKAPGSYGGNNYVLSVGEGKLTAAPLDMYLYHFILSWDTGFMELVPANATQDWSVKLTLDNGTLTAANAVGGSEVPVPATALLFGSSLLGLLGVRRKNS